MSRMNAQETWEANPTGCVVSKRRIEQSPLSDAPAVPGGTHGHIADAADGYLWVDFDGSFGVVCCDPSEVRSC